MKFYCKEDDSGVALTISEWREIFQYLPKEDQATVCETFEIFTEEYLIKEGEE